MILRRFLFLTTFASLAGIPFAFSQSNASLNGQQERVITTAVPFLTITPDARSAALGDAGVAISPDANSVYWNSAKLVFSEKKAGFAVAYNPWLRNLINDMSLSYLSGYYKIDERQAIGASLTYFDLGSIEFTNDQGAFLQNFNPREVAITAAYARKLADHFSMGVNLRFIRSNLTGYNSFSGGSNPGSTAAGDITAFYTNDVNWGGKDVNVAFGGMISNLGGKIGYNNLKSGDFIPTNLKLGTAITYHMDVYNKVTFALDLNKLMVPTPKIDSIYSTAAQKYVPVNVNANKGFLPGVFGSFTDAPGGFSEEMQEISLSAGVEYWYNDFFAARIGYFGENKNKGNRKYFTAGLGFRYQKLGFDFAYLFPQRQNSPLANTLRFTLLVNIDKAKAAKPEDITN